MSALNLVLLGCGFTGHTLKKRLESESFIVIPTNRNLNGNVQFDLQVESTWKNVPEDAMVIWLFPAEPIEKVKQFSKNRNIKIVLGTTSSYKEKTGLIDEKSELDLQIPRVEGEEYLRSEGATVLRCSGIYGYERNPFNWLKKGLIKNGNKTVNLIHVEDLAEIIVRLIKSEIRGDVFTVSDGEKYLWKDIVEAGKKNHILEPDFLLQESISEEKFVSNDKLKSFLGSEYEFIKLIY